MHENFETVRLRDNIGSAVRNVSVQGLKFVPVNSIGGVLSGLDDTVVVTGLHHKFVS